MKLISLLCFIIITTIFSEEVRAQKEDSYKVIDLKYELSEGKKKEVKSLFEGKRRKIAQLTLRDGNSLGSHSVEEPITIQCIAGKGQLLIGEKDAHTVELKPNTLVTIEANVKHDVIAKPAVSILLIRFFENKEN